MQRVSVLALTVAIASGGCGGCGTTPSTTDGGPDVLCICDLAMPRDFGTDHPTPPPPPPPPPPVCTTGLACDPVVGCNGSQHCQAEIPIAAALPDGGTADASLALYPGGYCTNATLGSPASLAGAAGACDPNADPTMPGMDGCFACARCIDLGPSSSVVGAPRYVQCARRCTPNATDNDLCRDGYQCAPDTATCTLPECQLDADCQHAGTDATGACTASIDPAGGACNTSTYRCQRPGTPGAHAGDHCTRSSDCEPDGFCFDECEFSTFTGGYCSKRYCNVVGNECASGGSCFHAGGAGPGLWLCVKPCTVDAEDASLVLGAGGHGDTCDPGFACRYDGRSPVGTAGSGGCLPGSYDDVTTPNVGAACTDDAQCYSPHGVGLCTFASPSSACAIADCAGYPDTEHVCGDPATTACFAGFSDGSSLCLHTCTTPADCASAGAPGDHACIQLSFADPNKYCWPACTMDTDCQMGRTCVGAAPPATAGRCQ